MRGEYFSGNLERNLKSLDDNFVSFFKREAMLRREIIEKKNIEKGDVRAHVSEHVKKSNVATCFITCNQ